METLVLLLMEKNEETGILEREIGSYKISDYGNWVSGIYLIKKGDKDLVSLRLTTDRDVEDWEYTAVFDQYDYEVYDDSVEEISEIEDEYNPTWEIFFEFIDSQDEMETRLDRIVSIHRNEMLKVYQRIQENKENYTEKP